MTIELPKLPYSYSGLEPFLSAEAVETHYTKHHKGYVDKTNSLISGTRYQDMSHDQIVSNSSGLIFNNASQAWNHEFYWNSMTDTSQTIDQKSDFGIVFYKKYLKFDDFVNHFKEMASSIFGSGWTWIIKDDSGNIDIINLKDGESPLKCGKIVPLIACDLWEHAFYIDYQNERDKYIESFIKVINWNYATSRYYNN